MKTMQIISRQTAYRAASAQCDCNCDCACMDQLTRYAVSVGQCDCNCDCACLNELTQSAVSALGDRACLSELYPSALSDQCDCDCDCACLDYHRRPAPLQVVAMPDVAWRRPAAIYSAPLSAGGEQYMLAFNPRTGQLPAVLSQAAATLWERFATPTHLGAVIESSDTAPAETRQAVKHLAALRLIEPEAAGASRTCADTPTTLAAWLHVTNACNLQCAYCYLCKTHEAMSAETGRQAVEAIFRSAQIHGFRAVKLKYAGGEPTLNFGRVLEMHQHARNLAQEHGLILDGVVLSNGVSLSERILDAMKANELRLMISLDGLGAMHDAQRVFPDGQGSFAWVERGIARAMERGVTPDISIVVSDRNAAGLPELMAWVLERDLPFGLNFYRENDCSASQQDLQLSEQRIIDALRAAYGVIAENLPRRSLMGSLLDRANLAAPHQHTCGAGRNYLVIDHHGQVSKCQMDMNHAVSSISAPDPLHDVRADQDGLQNLAVEDKEGCRECAWQHWCTGSCPLYTYRATGRYDIKSPNCAIYQALFPDALRLEGLRLLKYTPLSSHGM
jgi:uncharacterized protein